MVPGIQPRETAPVLGQRDAGGGLPIAGIVWSPTGAVAVEVGTETADGVQPFGRPSEGLPSGWTPRERKRLMSVNAESESDKNQVPAELEKLT